MSDFIRTHKRILYILGLVFLSALFVVLGKKSIKTDKIENRVYSIHAHNDKETDNIYYQKLVKGDRVSQTFTSDTKVDGVSFEFHRGQGSELSGRTYMTITDKKSGAVVYEDAYDNNAFPMDTLVDFKLYDTNLTVGHEYEIAFTSDVENESNAPMLYLQDAGRYKGTFTVNGQEDTSRALCLGVFRHSQLPSKIFDAMMMLVILVVMLILIAMFVKSMPVHRICMLSCIGLGIVYMLIVAPGKGCDSAYHYEVAYSYANNVLFKGNPGGKLAMRADDYEFYKKNFRINDSYYGLMSADAYMDLNDTASLFVKDSSMVMTLIETGNENFVPYIPYIAGIAIGRLLHLGALPTVYLARLFGIIVFALIIGLAVKIIPAGKEALMLLALMPMTLQEYSAFSYDGMCIAAAFLFVACWLAFMHDRADRRTLIMWIVAAVLLGACKKGTYIFFLLLLVPVTRAHMTRKEKAAVGGSMIASAVVFNIISYAVVAAEAFGLRIMAADGGYLPGSSYTLSYAVEHPFKFILMCIGSIIEKADYYFGSIIGTHLSANIQTVPIAVVVPFFVLIIIAAMETFEERTSDNRIIINTSERLAMLVSFFMSSLVMFFMMQVSTPVGWNIDGVTGRYFLPVLPLVVLCLYNCGVTVTKNTKEKVVAAFVCWHIVEVFYAVWAVLVR